MYIEVISLKINFTIFFKYNNYIYLNKYSFLYINMNLNFENKDYNNILDKIKEKSENYCPICRDSLNFDIITFDCNHSFHSSCFIKSFKKYDQKKCHICNVSIVLDKYKKSCTSIKGDKTLCNKLCFNNYSLCAIHMKKKENDIKKTKCKLILNLKKLKNQRIKIDQQIQNIEHSLSSI